MSLADLRCTLKTDVALWQVTAGEHVTKDEFCERLLRQILVKRAEQCVDYLSLNRYTRTCNTPLRTAWVFSHIPMKHHSLANSRRPSVPGVPISGKFRYWYTLGVMAFS